MNGSRRGGDPGGPGRYRGGTGSPSALPAIWPGYLSHGYFDESGQLLIQFVERRMVERLAYELGTAGLTPHQLRRFFGHCRRLETRLKSANEPWQQVQPDFFKLDVASADALGKRPPKIPRLFHDFVRTNVAAVRSERDFLRGFLPHFEALVGFASGELKERN